MKKSIFSLMTLAALMFMPLNANAQFFKKLGKAINKVDKAVDKALGTSSDQSKSASSTTAASGGVKVVNPIKGLSVEYKGVTWQKDFCGVNFVIRNTTNKVIRVYRFEKMKTFGDDGTEYQSRSIVGNNVTTLGNGDFDFEPGVPVKCTYALFDLPESGTKMSLCQLRTQTDDPGPLGGYKDSYIELRNVTIPPRAAAQSASSTGPFKGVWKMSGKGIEGKLNLDFYGKSIDGTDADYNNIKCYGTIYVAYGSGASARPDECSITAWKADGNKATVTFIGGRSSNTYQAVLTYNPTSKQVSVSGVKALGEDSGECYVTDGLVFVK